VYSINVAVPSAVGALASDLARDLPRAEPRPRDERTLVVKRLAGEADNDGHLVTQSYSHLEARAREALTGQPAFAARIDRVDYFAEAATGTSPVVYLAVESPELRRLHRELAAVFDPIDGIEGEDYIPHVTVARGGSHEAAERVAERDIDPIEWTVSELVFWDAERGLPVSRLSLPA